MIIALVLLGLAIVTLLAGFSLAPKSTLVALIPAMFAVYFVASNEVPKYFGYPVAMNFVDIDEALVLNAFQSGDQIILLVSEKGAKEPRLLSVKDVPKNREQLDQINKKKKNGPVVIKKGSGGKIGKSVGDEDFEGDFLILEFKDQTIIKKD